jgi:N-methylhydantoinase A
MLATNVRHDYRITRLQRLADTRQEDLARLFRELEERAVASLHDEGFSPDRIQLRRSLDLRYVGQSWKLPVACDGDDALDPARLKREFDRLHERQYGYAVEEEPVEIVNLALSAEGVISPLHLHKVAGDRAGAASAGELRSREGRGGPPPPRRAGATAAPTEPARDVASSEGANPIAHTLRPVYFRETGGFTETPVYDRYQLAGGASIEGPAIVAEMDATTVIHPGYCASVNRFGMLSIEPTAEAT